MPSRPTTGAPGNAGRLHPRSRGGDRVVRPQRPGGPAARRRRRAPPRAGASRSGTGGPASRPASRAGCGRSLWTRRRTSPGRPRPSPGASIERLPVISATMSMTASGAWATLPNRAIIATMTNGAGSTGIAGAIGSSSRQMPAPSRPPMTMPGPEDAARAAGADRERGREDLRERQDEDHPERDGEQGLPVEAGLDEAVAGAEDARDDEADAADQEPADRGLEPARRRPGGGTRRVRP